MKAKAVVFTDRNQVAFQDVDVPAPGENDVVIDVEVSWISTGTESSYLRGERVGGETAYKPGDPWPFPIVAGYQKVGIVTQVGAAVQHIRPGERVFAAISRVNGMFDALGGHVSPAVTPAHHIWKLPDDASPLDYAGLVLTQVGFNCGMRAAVQDGDIAVVIGDGLVGQWAAQTLAHRGANAVVLGRHDDRLRHLPANIRGIQTRRTDTIQELAALDRIAVVVDTVGDMDTCLAIQPYMKRDSHLVSAGFLGDNGKIDIQKLRAQEITLHTPSGWTRPRMDDTIAAIRRGALLTSPLITDRFRAEQAAEAWALLQQHKSGSLGVILDWTADGIWLQAKGDERK